MIKTSKRASGLVQTVIDPALKRWVEKQAGAEGLSVSAWLRRLLIHTRKGS